MTFLAPFALLALLAVVGPLIAHALRQGKSRTVVFPATRFVRAHQAATKERRRLQDQWLLATRLLSLVCLAVLGATPLASCSRLSLARDRGASVAVVLVVDDSGSMQVEEEGKTRLERALVGARELLLGTRSGDAIGIVLAGHPARLLLSPTTDLGRAKDALSEIDSSDRPTDLEAALSLAQDAISRLPQTDKQVVLLSDQATPRTLPEVSAALSIPLPELARPFQNCAVVRAKREVGHVRADVACTSGSAGSARKVELVNAEGAVLQVADLVETVELPLGDDVSPGPLTVRLSKASGALVDQVRADDQVDVEPKNSNFVVGLCADAKRSGLPTSGSTVLKAAIEALDQDVTIRPVTVVPDNPAELEGTAALLIDDPPGLTPEAASVIEGFARRGGVVFALLGSRVEAAPLGAVFAPLVVGAPAWSSGEVRGVDPNALGAFAALAGSWTDLPASGRVAVPEQPKDTRVSLRFADGQPLVLERPLEAGLFITTLLPSSVDVSDFALRPGFLALLDHVLYEARLRGSFASTAVGEPWEIPQATVVTGPNGRLPSVVDGSRAIVVPDRAGRYELREGEKVSVRFALRTAEEAISQPTPQKASARVGGAKHESQATDVSREVALVLLVLLLFELGLRVYKGFSGATAWSRRAPNGPRAGSGPLL